MKRKKWILLLRYNTNTFMSYIWLRLHWIRWKKKRIHWLCYQKKTVKMYVNSWFQRFFFSTFFFSTSRFAPIFFSNTMKWGFDEKNGVSIKTMIFDTKLLILDTDNDTPILIMILDTNNDISINNTDTI